MNKLLLKVVASLLLITNFVITAMAQDIYIPVDIYCTGDGQVQETYTYDGDRCGTTDYYSEGFIASYDFLPDENSELTNLYVNNVDRINDIYTHYSGSSGMVYTFRFSVGSANSVSSSISINPVFSPRIDNIIPVDIYCTGDGQVQETYTYDGDRCGTTDYYSEGFIASYDFLPDENSELTNLYVNNVDRINDIYTYYSGSSGMVYTFRFSVSTANSVSSSISINPVFSPHTYQISAYSADNAMGYVTGDGVYEVGSAATLVAIPYTDFIFSHWSDDNTQNPRTIIVEKNDEYVAHFISEESVNSIESKLNFAVYPNPSSDYATIFLSGIYNTVSLSIVDINGQIVASKSIECDGNNATSFDLKGFIPGIYFVYAVTADGNFSVRKLSVK